MFREVADIQTADILNLPVPEAEYRMVKVKPTELQEEMVEELGNRAERVRKNEVNPREVRRECGTMKSIQGKTTCSR